jgi:hypothetical protein
VDLPYESYRPGDTVTGSIKAELPDGSAFESAPTFQFSVNFEVANQNNEITTSNVEQSNLKLNLLGEGIFSFVIPNNTVQLLSTIGFVVSYESTDQTYSYPLVIT